MLSTAKTLSSSVRRVLLLATTTAERKKRTRSPGINAFPNGVVQRMAWRMAAPAAGVQPLACGARCA